MSVRVENVSATYGRETVLHDITASAPSGAITVLLGPNASGKSTLLRCIIGVKGPTHGRVQVNDQAVDQLRASQRAALLAYVPQRATVSASLTVREVVELGRYALPRKPSRVEAAIQRLELKDIADRSFQTLSVGQQQRVTFARALAQLEPGGCLVLDEPTSAMDLRHTHACLALLRELAEQGSTIIAVIHDVTAALAIADHLWMLDRGRLVVEGSAADVATVERLQALFATSFQRIRGDDGRMVLIPVAVT